MSVIFGKKRKNIDVVIRELLVFFKAQLSAFAGGVFDISLMVFLYEYLGIHYAVGTCIGGVSGAIVNFGINKIWTFKSKKRCYANSDWMLFLKFSIVVSNSILLKSAGTYLLTDFMLIDYRISRITIDLIVSLGFNFGLQRFWVFRKGRVN